MTPTCPSTLHTLASALTVAATVMFVTPPVRAEVTVEMNAVDSNGIGAPAGRVLIAETAYGVVFTPDLVGLPPGLHGFHVHESPNCGATEKDGQKVPAGAAGGHLDPAHAGHHGTPWGDGHLGDLPALYADASGRASQPVLAPRLKLVDLPGHALMIHTGADNHSDHPSALGGGGVRLFCGVLR